MKASHVKHLLFAAFFFVVGVLTGYILSEFSYEDSRISQWWMERGLAGKGRMLEK